MKRLPDARLLGSRLIHHPRRERREGLGREGVKPEFSGLQGTLIRSILPVLENREFPVP